MGGSGGGGWGRVSKGLPLKEWTQRVEVKTATAAQGTEVADTLSTALSNINAHDYDAIDTHRTEIHSALASEFEVQDTRFGGTHARKTDVAGLSDVDMLVSLGDYHEGTSSDQAISDFATRLRERFPNTNISAGKMAVTLRFADGLEMQVLPAFKSGDGYQISDGQGGWKKAYPTRFASELTSLNQSLSGNLIPTIKLARAVCDANQIDVKGYHLDNLAVSAFRNYTGDRTQAGMLQHFLGQAKALCLSPIPDVTGQSTHVDGSVTPAERKTMATKFRDAEVRLAKALKTGDMDAVKKLLGQ